MDMTSAAPRPAAASGSVFLWMHCAVLAGYALLGRGFAYAGIRPIYIGEISLVFGLAAMILSGAAGTAIASLPGRFLLLCIVWTAARTLPSVSAYGLDAVRDAMLCGYGLFAFCVAAVCIAWPPRFTMLFVRYRRFAAVFVFCAWAVFLASQAGLITVRFPAAPAPLGTAKGGDLLVHTAGITALAMTGIMRPGIAAIIFIFINFLVAAAANRGGMVSYAAAVAVCAALRPARLRLAPVIYGLCLFAIVLALVNPTISIGERPVSAGQILLNARSVVGSSQTWLDNTKQWRLRWWSDILRYTFAGPYFWSGKGFGVNLADDDGYQVAYDKSLRSPHNGHLTMLARGGVPAFGLWLLTNIGWLISMARGYRDSRTSGDTEWAGVFTFLIAYWTAFMVNATFDVFIEGPMGGIWYWTLFGVGLAARYIHRMYPETIRP